MNCFSDKQEIYEQNAGSCLKIAYIFVVEADKIDNELLV